MRQGRSKRTIIAKRMTTAQRRPGKKRIKVPKRIINAMPIDPIFIARDSCSLTESLVKMMAPAKNTRSNDRSINKKTIRPPTS
jgi:hypothetical protein